MEMKRIDYKPHCLYCGRKKEVNYDEYHKFFYCSCEDYKLELKLTEEIAKLENQLPDYKYEIIESKIDSLRWIRKLNLKES